MLMYLYKRPGPQRRCKRTSVRNPREHKAIAPESGRRELTGSIAADITACARVKGDSTSAWMSSRVPYPVRAMASSILARQL